MTSYNFNEFKKDELTRPRDKAWSNWFRFDKIGDLVQGYIRDVFYRPAQTVDGIDYDEARCVTLETPSGEMVNVRIKYLTFVLAKTDDLRLGDPLTCVFESEGKKKGGFPAKIINYYGKTLPENANNKTVAQLEAEDRMMEAEANAEKAAASAEAGAVYDGEPAAVATAPVAATAADVPFPSPSDTPVETPVDTAAEVATPTETATADSEKTA